ncbi:hypothetical protein YB2330_006480 [Saitoella coloradoensis]
MPTSTSPENLASLLQTTLRTQQPPITLRNALTAYTLAGSATEAATVAPLLLRCLYVLDAEWTQDLCDAIEESLKRVGGVRAAGLGYDILIAGLEEENPVPVRILCLRVLREEKDAEWSEDRGVVHGLVGILGAREEGVGGFAVEVLTQKLKEVEGLGEVLVERDVLDQLLELPRGSGLTSAQASTVQARILAVLTALPPTTLYSTPELRALLDPEVVEDDPLFALVLIDTYASLLFSSPAETFTFLKENGAMNKMIALVKNDDPLLSPYIYKSILPALPEVPEAMISSVARALDDKTLRNGALVAVGLTPALAQNKDVLEAAFVTGFTKRADIPALESLAAILTREPSASAQSIWNSIPDARKLLGALIDAATDFALIEPAAAIGAYRVLKGLVKHRFGVEIVVGSAAAMERLLGVGERVLGKEVMWARFELVQGMAEWKEEEGGSMSVLGPWEESVRVRIGKGPFWVENNLEIDVL